MNGLSVWGGLAIKRGISTTTFSNMHVFMGAHACIYSVTTFPQITIEAMKSNIDDVALQGIEFWSTVCDEENELACEALEAAENGHPPLNTSRFYVKGAMDYLVPILLMTLSKQVGVV